MSFNYQLLSGIEGFFLIYRTLRCTDTAECEELMARTVHRGWNLRVKSQLIP